MHNFAGKTRAIPAAFLALVIFASVLPACDEADPTDAGVADAGITPGCEGKEDGDPCGENASCSHDACNGTTTCLPNCGEDVTGSYDGCDGDPCYSTANRSAYCYFPGGTAVAGDRCGNDVIPGCHIECVVGVQCLDDGSGMRCLTVCTDDADCVEPAVCTDTTLGFSVCVEEEG